MALYDAVVIGSGFGGAVAAERIAKSGKSVLILEMGSEWDLTNMDNVGNRNADGSLKTNAEGRKSLEQAVDAKYLYNLYQDVWNDKLMTANGMGLGGGSIIFSSIFEKPPARIFDNAYGPPWPAGWDYNRLCALIDRVIGIEDGNGGWSTPYKILTSIPTYRSRRSLLVKYALERMYGSGPDTFPLARLTVRHGEYRCLHPSNPTCVSCGGCRGRCRACGYCTFGCIYGAKQSLMMNYIPRARHFGAQVWTEKMVTRIQQLPNGYYRIYYKNASVGHFVLGVKASGSEYSVDAKVAVLAGGALNTPALLLKSKNAGFLQNLSSQVGLNLSGNGDYASGLFLPDSFTINADGLTVTQNNFTAFKGEIMMGYARSLMQSEGFVVEDMWGPPIGVAAKFPVRLHDPNWAESGGWDSYNQKVTYWKNPSLYGPRQKEAIRKYHKRALGLAFFGEDGCNGRVYLDANGETAVNKPDLSKFDRYQGLLEQMRGVLPSGTRKAETILERKNKDYFVSVHNLASCRMADTIHDGVCDGNGEVFNYPNLYISDGSVVPRATVINPALTITAVCEGIADHIVSHFPQ